MIGAIERGEIRTLAVDTPAPSVLAHEILHANPYAFLDDAPLEERRARAVALRRTDPDLARGVGALDLEAIAEVRAQSRPDVRDAHELHDLLLTRCLLPLEDLGGLEPLADELIGARRAARARYPAPAGSGGPERAALVAAERIDVVRAALPAVRLEPDLEPPPGIRGGPTDPEEAARLIVKGFMEDLGPTTGPELASRLGLTAGAVELALLALEGQGSVLRGHFTPGRGGAETEWCDRRLLARIHHLTIGRLRREIEPVSAADLIRFLLRWQRVQPGTLLHGREGLLRVVEQLEGLELPAPAWERDVFPSRVDHYDPQDLEALCLSGQVVWGRLRLPAGPEPEPAEERPGPVPRRGRRPRGATRSAPLGFALREDLPLLLEEPAVDPAALAGLSPLAREVAFHLEKQGASFLSEVARAAGRLAPQVEEALWELVARESSPAMASPACAPSSGPRRSAGCPAAGCARSAGRVRRTGWPRWGAGPSSGGGTRPASPRRARRSRRPSRGASCAAGASSSGSSSPASRSRRRGASSSPSTGGSRREARSAAGASSPASSASSSRCRRRWRGCAR